MSTQTISQFELLDTELLATVEGGANWVTVGPTYECIDGKMFGTCRVKWGAVGNHISNCFNYGWAAAGGGVGYGCGRPQ